MSRGGVIIQEPARMPGSPVNRAAERISGLLVRANGISLIGRIKRDTTDATSRGDEAIVTIQ
jgi:hypothetical protein